MGGGDASVKKMIRFIMHVKRQDSIGIAAKTAFFFLLSIFPLMMVAGWAFSLANWSITAMEGFLPSDLLHISENMDSSAPLSNPVWALTALWAASSGVWALMKGVSHAYSGDKLPFVKARAMAVGFTLGFIAVLSLTLAFLAISRWIMMISVAGAIFLLLFALYNLTPGTSAKPSRALWTAALATGGWIAVSWGFEVYMRYFARYDALYGSIGAFLGIAVWVFLICFVIIIGAELGGYKE
jgi:membrane protein